MNGDFTRSTFRPQKHYSGVRMQQGRVQLDADWNEQVDIATHRTEAEATDVIGSSGAPIGTAGFELTGGPDPTIGKGRYYVDGILCENDADVSLSKQPDLPLEKLEDLITSPGGVAAGSGHYIAYLDVWERHITALEDGGIREVALGGPDTATRTKTVWQVKLLGPFRPALTCTDEPPPWRDLLDRTKDGRLSAQAQESETPPTPCEVPPSVGYRRLENQLYRVEVHAVAKSGAATLLKWSRDNGSIVTRWLAQDPGKANELTVSSIGRDDVLSFGPGQYAEMSDDRHELLGVAGVLVKLANAEGQVLTLDAADPNAALVSIADFPDKVGDRPNTRKVRRWDGVLEDPALNHWLELEDGVKIQLEPGQYHVGDYWLIPARTATADVEWPRDATGDPIPRPPAGIEHHYCRLAVLNRDGNGQFTAVDCRKLFPPLTGVTLLYAGGDGQEAMPAQPLPEPLRVRVVRGQVPVIGAMVRFTVATDRSVPAPVVSTAKPDGIAEYRWTLGAEGEQRVKAALLGAGGGGVPGQVVHFSANLSVASGVHYTPPSTCPDLAGKETVQDAIDALCARPGCGITTVGEGGAYRKLECALRALLPREGRSAICLHLLPGDHEFAYQPIEDRAGGGRLSLCGCGLSSRLHVSDGALVFRGFQSLALSGLQIITDTPPSGALVIEGCEDVVLRGLAVRGVVRGVPLVRVRHGARIALRDVALQPLGPESLGPPAAIVEPSLPGTAGLFSVPQWLALEHAWEAAARAAALPREQREAAAKSISAATSGRTLRLTEGERSSYAALVALLPGETLAPAELVAAFREIVVAALNARPEVALAVMDAEANWTLRDCDIDGIVVLHGDSPAEPFEEDPLGKLRACIAAGSVRFAGIGAFALSGCRGTRIVLDQSVAKLIADRVGSNDPAAEAVQGVFGLASLTDCVLSTGDSQLAAVNAHLTSVAFSDVDPERRIAACVIGSTAICVGNRGPLSQDELHTRLISVTPPGHTQQAANLLVVET